MLCLQATLEDTDTKWPLVSFSNAEVTMKSKYQAIPL